jgi:predicted DNA-binding transcriptional regulator AlpA
MSESVTVPAFLTKADLATLLQVKETAVDQLWKGGKLPPHILVGKKAVRWRADQILAWIESATKGGVA